MWETLDRSVKFGVSSITSVQAKGKSLLVVIVVVLLTSWLLLSGLLECAELSIVVVIVEVIVWSEIVVRSEIIVVVVVKLSEVSPLSKGHSENHCKTQTHSKTELHFDDMNFFEVKCLKNVHGCDEFFGKNCVKVTWNLNFVEKHKIHYAQRAILMWRMTWVRTKWNKRSSTRSLSLIYGH